MSAKFVAVALGVMMISGPALADCQEDLSDLNTKISKFKTQASFGSDLRKLRSAAVTFSRWGRDDACEEVVEEIDEMIDDRKEERQERREEAEEIARYTEAVPVRNLPGIVRASTVQGLDVVGPRGEGFGIVEDVAIDSTTGRIAYVVMSHGGLLGIGEKHLPVPWSVFRITKDREDLVLPVSEETVENAPSFEWEEWPDMNDKAWKSRIDDYYGSVK